MRFSVTGLDAWKLAPLDTHLVYHSWLVPESLYIAAPELASG